MYFFAGGHFICNSQIKNTFYCKHENLIVETLQQIDFVKDINVQKDLIWDTYFDFCSLLHWRLS